MPVVKMPKTEAECRALDGKVVYAEGSPTWHGKRMILCKIPLDKHPEYGIGDWQKHGFRVVIMGHE